MSVELQGRALAIASEVERLAAMNGSTPDWPVLDPAALHGIAGSIIGTIEPHTEADSPALLATLLTAFGAAVGRGPHARADGAEHPARLFTVIVGDTARARKGTSWQQVKRVLAVADQRFVLERVMNGFGSGEALVDAVAPRGDDGPTDHRLLTLDPEWSRVLAVGRREGSTLSHIYRQAWDGDRLAVHTRSAGDVVADGAHVTVCGHITVEELRSRLTETETANGFANRHCFFLARRSKLLPEGGNLDDSEIHRLGTALGERLDAARKIGNLTRTPEAAERWSNLYHRMAEDEPGGLLGAVVARSEAQVLRLSVTYALLDGTNRIDTPHIEAAWAVWRYCRASAELVFGDAVGDPVADKILQALADAGDDGLDKVALHKLFGRHETGARIQAAITRLLALDRITESKEATPGRSRSLLRIKRTKRSKPLNSHTSLNSQHDL